MNNIVIPWRNESLVALRDDLTGKSQQLRCAVVRSVIDEALIYRKANEVALSSSRYVFSRSVDQINRTSRGQFHERGMNGALVEVARYCPIPFEYGWTAYVGNERLGSFTSEVLAMDAIWERLSHHSDAVVSEKFSPHAA